MWNNVTLLCYKLYHFLAGSEENGINKLCQGRDFKPGPSKYEAVLTQSGSYVTRIISVHPFIICRDIIAKILVNLTL
jgi:hypothetical protein